MKLNQYYFTRQELRGICIIVVIILLIGILRLDLYRNSQKNIQYTYLPVIPLHDEISTTRNKTHQTKVITNNQTTKPKNTSESKNSKAYLDYTAPFDPNTVQAQQLLEMKFPKQGVQNLIKYRNKSGVIRSVSHFKQIWGFEHIDSVYLESILLFPKPKTSKPEFKKEYSNSFTTPKFTFKEEAIEPVIININQADTSELKLLNGIGSYRAKKIIQHRDLLGGFYSIDQLDSLYWLPDSVFQDIKHQMIIDSASIKAIKVNAIGLDELVKHPYINYSQARMISNYIIEHGPLIDKNELYSLRGLDSTDLTRLLPYFSVEEE